MLSTSAKQLVPIATYGSIILAILLGFLGAQALSTPMYILKQTGFFNAFGVLAGAYGLFAMVFALARYKKPTLLMAVIVAVLGAVSFLL